MNRHASKSWNLQRGEPVATMSVYRMLPEGWKCFSILFHTPWACVNIRETPNKRGLFWLLLEPTPKWQPQKRLTRMGSFLWDQHWGKPREKENKKYFPLSGGPGIPICAHIVIQGKIRLPEGIPAGASQEPSKNHLIVEEHLAKQVVCGCKKPA